MKKAMLLGAALALFANSALAAGFGDPTWPCIQRKVENLSLGLMWPHPIEDGELSKGGRDLIAILSLRRVGLDEAETYVQAFMKEDGASDPQALGRVFKGVFANLGEDRSRIMRGIANYAGQQIALSERIDDTRVAMKALQDGDTPDYDRIDKLEEQIDWDERIYRDRERSLTYVCETPVLIEKRLYAIAQLLMKHAPE